MIGWRIWTVYLRCTRITRETTAQRVKLPKPTDWMGRIRTASLLCTRITLETTALRVMCTDPVQLYKYVKPAVNRQPGYRRVDS